MTYSPSTAKNLEPVVNESSPRGSDYPGRWATRKVWSCRECGVTFRGPSFSRGRCYAHYRMTP